VSLDRAISIFNCCFLKSIQKLKKIRKFSFPILSTSPSSSSLPLFVHHRSFISCLLCKSLSGLGNLTTDWYQSQLYPWRKREQTNQKHLKHKPQLSTRLQFLSETLTGHNFIVRYPNCKIRFFILGIFSRSIYL
jgi:hypothetical protein